MTDVHLPEAVAGDVPTNERTLRFMLALVLVTTTGGGAVDMVLDAPESWLSAHVIFEASLMLLALGIAAWLWHGWWRSEHVLAATRSALVERAAERDAWRSSAESLLATLGQAIDARLSAWGLTAVEREVAVQILKGRSHKQIAFGTGRSERTVRQHAVAIYQKSGLNGRAELAAFFLEGIPDRAAPDRTQPRCGAAPSRELVGLHRAYERIHVEPHDLGQGK
jgi:DNA-binding CsgD family transcriptional regulator